MRNAIPFRVLCLDKPEIWNLVREDLESRGIMTNAIFEQHLLAANTGCKPGFVSSMITLLTVKKIVDLVVIGNDSGAGFGKAMCVASNMKDMTVITWHLVRDYDAEIYRAKGFKHFCSRPKLADVVSGLLEKRVRADAV